MFSFMELLTTSEASETQLCTFLLAISLAMESISLTVLSCRETTGFLRSCTTIETNFLFDCSFSSKCFIYAFWYSFSALNLLFSSNSCFLVAFILAMSFCSFWRSFGRSAEQCLWGRIGWITILDTIYSVKIWSGGCSLALNLGRFLSWRGMFWYISWSDAEML